MKDRTKEVIKDGFGSLINNAAVIRGAKNGPLWLTIVMFVLSIIVAVIPNFVSEANKTGSTFLKSASYKLDEYITSVALDLSKYNKEFAINEDHELVVKENGAAIDLDNHVATTPYATYASLTTNKYEFMVYVSGASHNVAQSTEITAIRNQYFVTKEVKTTEKDEEGKDVEVTTYINEITNNEAEGAYHPSFLIFFKNTVFLEVYSTYTSEVIARSAIGDYETMAATDDLIKDLLTVKDSKDKELEDQSLKNSVYINGVYTNFKKFLNKSYESLRVQTMWSTTGLYAGIFFGLTLLMGFVIWILTRGKNNPNNYFSVWLCYKIQARLGLAPALIALIVGFFFSQSPVIFIAVVGLRVMWMSMKDLRPMPQA